VRLFERFLPSDPPTPAELNAARQFASASFATFPQSDTPPLIAGIGGTALNIAAVTQGAAQPDPDTIHGATLSAAEVSSALARLASAPLEQRRTIPGLDPKRADVIVAGAVILDTLLTYFHADHFLLSARGLRYGLLADYAKTK